MFERIEQVLPEVQDHFERMISSQHFLRAEGLRNLLVYIWNHRGEPISEYAIATDGLGRREDFDPRSDASVRVQMSRLRQKLKDYYEQETDEPEILSIPMGSHQIAIARLPVPETEQMALPRESWWRRYPVQTLGIACAVLLVSTVWFWHARNLALAENGPRDTAGAFLKDFFSKGRQAELVLPTPAFFSFSGAKGIRIRSTDVNDLSETENSPAFVKLTSGLGISALEHSYTVTSDTLAALDLARYLDAVGLGKQLSVEVTGNSNSQALDHVNVIALGTRTALTPFRDYLKSMNFALNVGDNGDVSNAKPVAGEPATFPRQILGTRTVQPSVLAILPGRAPGYRVMLIQSNYTSAVVALLTSHQGDRMVEKMIADHGKPEFYEMVIMTELEGGQTLRSWPIAIHPYKNKAIS